MALKRASFSVTVDSNGVGSDDVHLPIPSPEVRFARVEAVSFDPNSVLSGRFTLTISEVVDVSDETWNTTSEDTALGDQLVYLEAGDFGASSRYGRPTYVLPRRRATYTDGKLPSADDLDGRPLIRENDVRLEVYGGRSGDVYAVDLVYETAGDWRF